MIKKIPVKTVIPEMPKPNQSKKQYTEFDGRNPFASQAKLLLHHDKLNQYLTNGDVDCPIFMEVGLTDKCNMECEWCITENGRDNKHGDSLSLDALEGFLSQFSSMGGKAITYCGQGEPTFYRYFEDAVDLAKKHSLKLGLMTNGVYKERYNTIIGKNFEWIRISLDTLNAKDYLKWKRVDGVHIIKRNIDALAKYPVKVGINCNVGNNITVEHAKELIEWSHENQGVSYIQFRPILPRYYKSEEKRYIKTEGVSGINNDVWNYLDEVAKDDPIINLSDDKRYDLINGTAFSFRSCEGHFFEPILNASGEVKVCTYHPTDKNLTFGNINESSFSDIWKSEKRKEAIKYVRSLDYMNKCQMCCKLSEPNKLIDFLTHPDEIMDIDFL
jgi:GTP 3',8-cyclase